MIVAVIIAGLAGLYVLGSTVEDYKPLLDSYFAYTEDDSIPRVESLFYPDVYDYYVEHYGRGEAIGYADSWTKYYGRAVDRYEISSSNSQSGSLADFNESFGVQAGEYLDVTVNVYYEDGTYACIDFDIVEVEGAWYLVDTW